MKLDLEIAPLSSWLSVKSQPLVIAGPCSAETEKQLIDSCLAIAATGKVSMLRAGIWKPRTRPGEFEGIGEIGLEWLMAARKECGLPVTVEVATAAHVELASALASSHQPASPQTREPEVTAAGAAGTAPTPAGARDSIAATPRKMCRRPIVFRCLCVVRR